MSLIHLWIKGDNINKQDLLNKLIKGNQSEQYFKIKNDGSVKEVLDKIKNLGVNLNNTEVDPKNKDKYEKLSENDINNIKFYFKDKEKEEDYKGEKENEDSASEYFYKTKIIGNNKDKEGNKGKIKSIIVKGDIDNDLHKGKNAGQIFKDKTKNNETPIYYYTKVLGVGK